MRYVNVYQSDRLSDGQTIEGHQVYSSHGCNDMSVIVVDKRIVIYYEPNVEDKFDKIFNLLKRYISKVIILDEDFVHPPIQEIEREERSKMMEVENDA
jgi:hypothetical protein